LEKRWVFDQAAQADHWPPIGPTSERPGQIPFAANKRRWRHRDVLRFGETPESEHFVDQQTGWNVAVIYHQDARRTHRWRHPTA
jgi:hypothetical protein